jgi:hypothetical protein
MIHLTTIFRYFTLCADTKYNAKLSTRWLRKCTYIPSTLVVRFESQEPSAKVDNGGLLIMDEIFAKTFFSWKIPVTVFFIWLITFFLCISGPNLQFKNDSELYYLPKELLPEQKRRHWKISLLILPKLRTFPLSDSWGFFLVILLTSSEMSRPSFRLLLIFMRFSPGI